MLNKNVGSFTFIWELIIKENLLRGLISRLYLDIVAGVRQEREHTFIILWPVVSFADFFYRVISPDMHSIVACMALQEHPLFLLFTFNDKEFLALSNKPKYRPSVTNALIILVGWRYFYRILFSRPA